MTNKRQLAQEAARMGLSVATGGVGRAVNKTAQRYANTYIQKGAAFEAQKYLEKNYGGVKRKLTGGGFWMIFSISLIKEAIDVALTFTVVLSILVTMISMTFAFIIWFYLFTHGVKMNVSKTVTMAISILIEMMPFLSILPTFPVTLLAIRYMEKKEFKEAKKGALRSAEEFALQAQKKMQRAT